MPPVDTTVLAPGKAVFTCTVEGFPLPTITWVMDNTVAVTLIPGDNIAIVESSSSSFSAASNLTILSTNLTLAGVYVCVAANTEGMVNGSALLTVNGT